MHHILWPVPAAAINANTAPKKHTCSKAGFSALMCNLQAVTPGVTALNQLVYENECICFGDLPVGRHDVVRPTEY